MLSETFKKNITISVCLIILFCCFFSIVLTSTQIGWTWDEVYYFLSSELQIEWARSLFASLSNGKLAYILSQKVLDSYWLWDPYHNPHPPLSKIFSSVTLILFGKYLGDFTAYRLSSAFFAAILMVALFYSLRERYSLPSAMYGSFALLFMPRFFGHAHLATTEIPLMTFWFLSCWAFIKGLKSILWSALLGIFLGGAIDTKFTGLLVPFPLLLWTILYREKRALRNIMFAFSIAPVIAVVINPGWWYQPFHKIFYFFQASLLRQAEIPIKTFFLGKVYSFSPPWVYPFVMLAITIPVTVLLTIALGGLALMEKRRQKKYDILFIMNIPFILAITMLPNAPVHDGIRQFISILPFLAYLSGMGFSFLSEVISKNIRARVANNIIVTCILLIFIGYPALQVKKIHPFELSYYNILIGGLKGAYRKGMEMSYWFDAANGQFLKILRNQIPKGSVISVWPPNKEYFEFLQSRGKIKKNLKFLNPEINVIVAKKYTRLQFKPEVPDYLILLSRFGAFNQFYWNIYYKNAPQYSVTCEDVPLISIYRWSDIHVFMP